MVPTLLGENRHWGKLTGWENRRKWVEAKCIQKTAAQAFSVSLPQASLHWSLGGDLHVRQVGEGSGQGLRSTRVKPRTLQRKELSFIRGGSAT